MKKYFIIFFFAFLFANVIAIDVWVVRHSREATPAVPLAQKCDFSRLPSPAAQAAGGQACPQSCLEKINEATAGAKTVEVPAAKTVTVIVTPAETQLKEFYVALGGGSGQGNDWQNIDNSKTVIDLSKFGKIKYIVFEIVGRMVDDNVSATARLYNVDDKRVINGSEINFGKLSCQLTSSAPFTLEAAVKTYQIQIKTMANAIAYIDQARLRIVVE